MTDIVLDTTNDLLIKNGDFVLNDTEGQDIAFLLESFKGEWKEHPLVGAEIIQLVKSRATETRIKRDVYEQLSNDGFRQIEIKIEYPDVNIDAKR